MASTSGIQTSSCSVERGLHALRYVSSRLNPAPLVSFQIISGPISFISAPGRQPFALTEPGQSIVILANAPGIIEIRLESAVPGQTPEASLSLDLLDRGGGTGSLHSSVNSSLYSADKSPGQGRDVAFEIEAHVSRIGDVRVPAGTWIAGPECPLPIEGVTLLGGEQSSNLEVQVQSGIHPGAWSPWLGTGHFAGTRQRAEYLTGMRLRLAEPKVTSCTIVAEALFLGSATVKKEGKFVEFSSHDPLVGLKIDVVQRTSAVEARHVDRKIQVFRAQ